MAAPLKAKNDVRQEMPMNRFNEPALELRLYLALTALMVGASLYTIARPLLVGAAWPGRRLRR
jgi:hypothetical protein